MSLVQGSTLIKKGNPSIYLYPKKTFTPEESSRTISILLVGETGSGKTTLLNSLVNAVMEVKFEDPFRYVIIKEETGRGQHESQTSDVTIYYLLPPKGSKIPPLKIVDTPGFGDTRGLEEDEKIFEKISDVFKNKIDIINAICFVAKSSGNRLSSREEYIYNKVLNLFGNDIKENFVFMLTFCDANKPSIIKSLESDKSLFKDVIPFIKKPYYYKFNNSAIFADNVENEDDDEDFEMIKMFWKLGMDNFTKFINRIKLMNSKSLRLTKEVLKKRKQLETTILGLNSRVTKALAKIDNIKNVFNKFKIIQGNIKDIEKEDFSFYTTEEYYDEEPMPKGECTTYCANCCQYCHDPCWVCSKEKQGCSAMSGEYCTVCRGKCHWTHHIDKYTRPVKKTRQVKNEKKNLMKKYTDSKSKLSSQEQILRGLKNDFEREENECYEIIKDLSQVINQLNEIALNTKSYITTDDYIDEMILGIETDKKDKWQEKVKSLKEMKQKKELIRDISTKGSLDCFDSLSEFKEELKKMI